MEGRRRRAVGSLLAATILLGTFGAGTALAQGPADDPGTQAKTTQATVDRANALKTQTCNAAAASAAASAADPDQRGEGRHGRRRRGEVRDLDRRTPPRKQASLAGVNGGIASDAGKPTLPPTRARPRTARSRATTSSGSRTRAAPTATTPARRSCTSRTSATTSCFGDGTGGLSIWSLKNPEQPTFVGAVPAATLDAAGADSHGPADTQARFYEGENPTVDSRRKLAFLARDPRSFGNGGHPNGRTGLYIIDVKDPWAPAGPDATTGSPRATPRPASTTAATSGASARPTTARASPASRRTSPACCIPSGPASRPSSPTCVTRCTRTRTRKPVDMKRNNNTTAYTHSVDVDQHGLAWTSGFGGVRGYYTNGLHHDPMHERRPLRDGDRPGPVRRRRRPVAGDGRAVRAGQPRAQLVPPHAGGVGHVAADDHDGRAAGRSTRPTCSTSRRRTSRAARRPAAAAPAAS